MHSMLRKFYNYLINKLVQFFEKANQLKAGDRYNFYIEDENQLKDFYETLKECETLTVDAFEYTGEGSTETFKSFTIQLNGIKLLVVSEENGTENYITFLRNQVAKQDPGFEKCALLILYSGQLDSLSGGSESLSKKGMPFSFVEFAKGLKKEIDQSDLAVFEKELLYDHLQRKQKLHNFDSTDILDLNILASVLYDGELRHEDYHALDLFPDPILKDLPSKEQRTERREKNFNLFEQIQYAIQDGNLEHELDGILSPDGITYLSDHLENGEYLNSPYDKYAKYADRKEAKPIVFEKARIIDQTNEQLLWIREDGESKAQKRKNNLIVFNPEGIFPLKIQFEFDQFVKEKLVESGNKKAINFSTTTSGKKIELTINDFACNSEYIHIQYRDSAQTSNLIQFKIIVLPFVEELLDGIKERYIIQKKGVITVPYEDELKLKKQGTVQKYSLPSVEVLELNREERIILEIDSEIDKEYVPFKVRHEDIELEMQAYQKVEAPKHITGWNVWQNKRIEQESFRIEIEDERVLLSHGNEYYSVREDYRKNLFLEAQLMKQYGHRWIQLAETEINEDKLVGLPKELNQAYNNYYQYIQSKENLPSLLYLDEVGVEYATRYVDAFIRAIDTLPPGKGVKPEILNALFCLGTVKELFGDQKLKLSPLHPLNVAYQLELNKAVGEEKLYDSILRKMTAGNLLPYFRWNESEVESDSVVYGSKANDHSPEWHYYSNDYKFKQLSTKGFVRGLVKQKISDFIRNFGYLFDYHQDTPIKINAINMGDCESILQGIFDYYKGQVSDGVSMYQLRPIEVHIYGSKNYVTKFEEFAHYEDTEEIKKEFEIDFNSKKYDFKELVNQFRNKVDYYISELEDKDHYVHLSFFQFNSEQLGYENITSDELVSGISLGGLINDIPSDYDGTAYKTGFGTKYHKEENKLSEIGKKYNQLARIVGTSNPFDPNESMCTVIKKNIRSKLKRFYSHSQWVCFIDPRFDLSFFKDDSDVIIIHYSDQYSNASGYDAITVTEKSEQYEYVLQELLQDFWKEEDALEKYTDESIKSLINLFNAINGEWLLGMISDRNTDHVKREKLSLLSAVKSFLAIHDRPDVIWIPISLEEILRISGGAGLKSKDGLFSAKNLGANGKHCDDLLMIGLREKDSRLEMHLYPLEVKIGSPDKKKAYEQVSNTFKLLKEHLCPEQVSFRTQLYRNFFAKLCIINASKLDLYEVWTDKNWKKVTEDYRERLLNNDFVICDDFTSIIGCGGTMMFLKDLGLGRKLNMEAAEVLSMQFLENDAYTLLLNSIPNIKKKFVETEGVLDSERILDNCRINVEIKEEIIAENIESTKEEIKPMEDESFKSQVEETELKKESDHVDHVEIMKFDMIGKNDKVKIYSALRDKFEALRIEMQSVHVDEVAFVEGPAFYRMALYPSPRTTQSKIESVINEINLVLGLPREQSVRIFGDLGTLWLEVPKKQEHCVMVKTKHIWKGFKIDEDFKIPFGVDISGEVISVDFSSSNSPHLLMAGTTGSGKSVVLDTLIRSATKFYSPEELNLFLIDPKGNELIDFEDLDHVKEENGESSEDAISLLKRGVDEMQRRYQLFKDQKQKIGKAAKNIDDFNENTLEKIPRWIIVLDEYADLIEEDADNKKEIESLLKRLSQKARAAGIHVILATQKPLANIVSSSIKANLPGVLALKVKTSNDSRVVLDENGAETLAGNGDSLFKNGAGKVVRVQCAIHKD